jgi:hypothetical protein
MTKSGEGLEDMKVGYVTVGTLLEAVDGGQYRRADLVANGLLRRLQKEDMLKTTQSGRLRLNKKGKLELARRKAEYDVESTTRT